MFYIITLRLLHKILFHEVTVDEISLITKAQVRLLKYFNPHAKIWPRDHKELSPSFNNFNVLLK